VLQEYVPVLPNKDKVAVCPLEQIVTADDTIDKVGADEIETLTVADELPHELETLTV
jgi:hypothetical protein